MRSIPVLIFAIAAFAQEGPNAAQHPALFLVGDSIMRTGTGDGSTGPWGMGYELIPMFDAARIHVYNEGLGGRSSRGYREEGAWGKVLARVEPGDFVILMFGHNDAANSDNYPDRVTLPGVSEEVRGSVHTYGWYLKKYVEEIKGKGGTAIVCSPVPRNTWVEGRIKRGFDGYASWAADAAAASGARFIDLNTLAANRYDALGKDRAAAYFNDTQHTTKLGARLNAEAMVEGIRGLKDGALAAYLPLVPSLYVLGDSTAAEQTKVETIQGWGVPFQKYFDPAAIHVVNAARGGRSSRTFITEGLLDAVVAKLRAGDTVLIQFGHNDVFPINDKVARGSLHGTGEQTEEIENQVTGKHETVHTYGWYMRKFVNDVRAKGANPVILTLTIRDRWEKDGKIERNPAAGLDLSDANRFSAPSMYSVWAKDVARELKVPVIDVHNMIADRYDREGAAVVSTYFHSAGDPTHRNPLGAEVDAEITVSGLKTLLGAALNGSLSVQGKVVPAADDRYISRN